MSIWKRLYDAIKSPPPSPETTKEAKRNRDDGKMVGVPIVNPKALADLDDVREFYPPDIDFASIYEALDTDSYITQAVERYLELMFKAGWSLKGANPNAVRYVQDRLNIIAESTRIPTELLLMEMAEDLVLCSNTVVSKVRDNNFVFPTGINVQPLSNRGPVVGYYPLNIEQLSVRRNRFGVIQRWKQEVQSTTASKNEVVFAPEDVVHIYYRKRKGEPMGRPFLTSAIGDVKALRLAEEQVLRLIYRNLFPFVHAKVGDNETPGEDWEIQGLQEIIDEMSLEGGLATSERIALNPVAVNQIISAHEYLLYFEKRVFTALGVSEVIMGRAASASRASAENLSVEMRDRIKALQRVLAMGIDSFIVHELLLEGGFDPITNPQDDVDFVFNEIDLDSKIKQENHVAFLYEHEAITEEEMRYAIGREEVQDRSGMRLNRVTIPRIQATRQDRAPSSGAKESQEIKEPQSKGFKEPQFNKDRTDFEQVADLLRQTVEQARTPEDFIREAKEISTLLPDLYRESWQTYWPEIQAAALETTHTPILVTTLESIFDLIEIDASRRGGTEFAK